MGFMQGGAESKKPMKISLLAPKCGACGLHKTCNSPKMKPTGQGKRKILIVGEAPGANEDERGKQFIGQTGQDLRRTLRKFGVDPDRDCIFTNALICRPPNNTIKDKEAVSYCRPNLVKTVNEFNPHTILLLGSEAVKSMMGWVWKDDWGQLFQWVGWQIPCQNPNVWICPTWHPRYVQESDAKSPVVRLLWEQHIEKALSLSGKPHQKVINYDSLCRVTFDSDEAINTIRRMRRASKPVAFDLETDRIKPDHKDAYIACCSVSDGKEALSFPWNRKTMKAMWELLDSDTPMIGYNISFENKWVVRFKGSPVKKWLWDGQIACHILDNRDRITSLKFQSFLNFGAPEYDWRVKPYLSSTGDNDNSPNRIRELDPKVLMQYNSIDSYLEWHLAVKQRKEFGYET